MNTTDKHTTFQGIAQWVIAILVLLALLAVVTMLPRRANGPTDTQPVKQQEPVQEMQLSDDLESIQQDIEMGLQTEFIVE